MTQTVLIVDDEPTQREIIRHVIEEKLYYKSVVAGGGKAAIDYILEGTQPSPDLILLDLSMPQVGGMDVIRGVLAVCPDMPIIILTLYGDVDKAAAAMRAGACDFLSKPVTVERLGVSIRNTFRACALRREVERLNRMHQGEAGFGDLVGVSADFRWAVEQCKNIAASDAPVLIEGERGTGKTSLASAIHGASRRRGRNFSVFDCRNLSEFPSANLSLKDAIDGTIFLKEANSLSPAMQERLLKELGGKSGRIIASTTKPLEMMVAQGRFRRDLFARLHEVKVELSPLRERREDIQPLAEHFMKIQASVESVPANRFTQAAIGLLVSHSWHGNVRQLKQAVCRGVLFCRREAMDIEDFQHLLMPLSVRGATVAAGSSLSPIALGRSLAAPDASAEPMPVLTLVGGNGQMKRMNLIEAEILRFAIGYYGGHMSEVARRLGIGRSTLYRKMQEMDIGGAQSSRGVA